MLEILGFLDHRSSICAIAIPDLEPANEPVEEYVSRVEDCVEQHGIAVCYGEEIRTLTREKGFIAVTTWKGTP